MRNLRSVCSYRAMILLGSWRYGGIACITEVVQCTDAGSLGRTVQEVEEEMFLFV